MSSRIRVGDLYRVFKAGSSPLLNQIARLSLLFEDLRIEIAGILAPRGSVPAMDTLGEEHRQLYFLRRSLISLVEMRKCLAAITGTEDFKTRKPLLPEKHQMAISEAHSFLSKNERIIQQLRNEFGGHLDKNVEDDVLKALEPGSVSKISWVESPEGDEPWLQLHFAHGLLVMAIKKRLKPGIDFEKELNEALDTLVQAKLLIQNATYALTHAFLWDEFG